MLEIAICLIIVVGVLFGIMYKVMEIERQVEEEVKLLRRDLKHFISKHSAEVEGLKSRVKI